MFSKSERLLIFRFLFSKKSDGYVSIFSWFSIIGISLGVAVLIIVMSVMNGFRIDLTNRIIGLNSHLNIFSFSEKISTDEIDQFIPSLDNYSYIELYKTLADAEEENYHTYEKAQIKDPAQVDNAVYNYTIQSNSPSNAAKEEGSEVEVTITRVKVSGTEGKSTIYLNTTTGSATKEDFEFTTKKELNFTSSDKVQKVTIKLTQDGGTEQKEYFYLDLFEIIKSLLDSSTSCSKYSSLFSDTAIFNNSFIYSILVSIVSKSLILFSIFLIF